MSNGNNSKTLEQKGLVATKIYVVLLVGGIPLLAYFGIIEITKLTLNELGDFLAGAFGPLALFWLVLGFFQQGYELRNSVDTLELQTRELANSVEKQGELVKATREQLEHERHVYALEDKARKQALEPQFTVKISQKAIAVGAMIYQLTVLNSGAKVSNVDIRLSENKNTIQDEKLDALENGKKRTISLPQKDTDVFFSGNVELIIKYNNAAGTPCAATFDAPHSDNKRPSEHILLLREHGPETA